MTKITVQQGDITKLEVDVIVNAANTSLLGGGGVDGAIHRAGGASILEECKAIRNKQGGCATGEAVITNAGNLPAKKVIHTVGPVWYGGKKNEPEDLSDCYRNSLLLAAENHLKTIAFPNISTGVYSYPKKEAAKIAVDTVKAFVQQHPHLFDHVIFVCFDDENFKLYESLLNNSPSS
jgi:O-acetyl-ADP-ribose deacetylase (regulator of RNase III)